MALRSVEWDVLRPCHELTLSGWKEEDVRDSLKVWVVLVGQHPVLTN